VSEASAWRARLPDVIGDLLERWSIALYEPFTDNEHGSWVAPAVRNDGSHAVLKLGLPHMEGEHEIHGLQFWAGNPTVRIFDADVECNAMLLERCEPGNALSELPEHEQDVVIAGLLRRLWRAPASPHPFRQLSEMLACWTAETMADAARWPDAGVVHEGLALFKELSRPSANDVLLATDLHAGNVLRAEREPWLVIDPKPFIGDRAYDATQHLMNCPTRMRKQPHATIQRFADLLEIDAERIKLWMFARAAAAPRKEWSRR
jgi:streptomycin 6-kinase